MYIWIACNVQDSLAELRELCLRNNEDIKLDTVAFTLPAHISLKISFEVPDSEADGVISTVAGYLSGAPHFSVSDPHIEQNGSILWVSYRENDILDRLHSELDQLLLTRHGVEQHPYDKCFKFHSTLFIDERVDGLQLMMDRLSAVSLPREIKVQDYIIGTSHSGKAGEYHVRLHI